MSRWSAALALSLAVGSAFAQLPASDTLSASDQPLFDAEISRLEKLLIVAPDKATVTYAIARTWASAKQWPETVQWLRKVVDMRAGFDPSRDSIFHELRGTREFDALLAGAREATPPVSRSTAAFVVPEGDLVPESMAYDLRGRYFYLGSTKKGKVIRCSPAVRCTQFCGGLGAVLGLKAHGSHLWLLSNSENESALIGYDLASARMVHRYAVSGSGHEFNDLVVAPAGDVYLTDTRAGSVWHLPSGATALTQLPGRFEFANGIALSPDGTLLYVSTFPDGVTMLDLKTHVAAPIARPADLCLAAIDGLYFHRGALIAIQNGPMSPRVVRFTLAPDLRAIERFEVLERRNPVFDGVTTGVLVGNDFYYMANTQDGKTANFNPLTILKIHL